MGTRQTTGNLSRQLQLGLDHILKHVDTYYKGAYKELFRSFQHDKGYYEFMQEAGMSIASPLGEGAAITAYDTVDQDWVYRKKMIIYEKSARITKFAQRFNLYEDMMDRLGEELKKAHEVRKDYDCANILNNGFDVTNNAGPDGSALFSATHSIIKTGDTSSNLVSQDLDEDAIEQMCILVDKFLNPDGIQSDYTLDTIVYPTDLQFDIKRILGSEYRPSSADNDINALVAYGKVKKAVMWKRLTDTDAFFGLTNCDRGLCIMENLGYEVEDANDPYTKDIILSALSCYRAFFEDWRLGVGSAGV